MKIFKTENQQTIDAAINALKAGKIISFNCETVYGLAVDASNFKAVENLYHVKNRHQQKPLVIFLPNLEAAEEIFHFDEISRKIAQDFLPGNLTLVLKTKTESQHLFAKNLNQNQSAKSDNFYLGLRIVDNKFVADLLKKFGGIIAVTSANKSGKPDAINADEVSNYFTNDEIELIVDSGTSSQKIPSTIAKISDGKVEILRVGAIPEKILRL